MSTVTQPLISPLLDPDILRQNTWVDGQEGVAVRLAISEATAHIVALEADIAQQPTSPDTLVEQRQAAVDFKNAHARLLHPIHRLPAEIIADIFSLCHPDDFAFSIEGAPLDANLPQVSDTPVVFTRVSRRWRSIAITTPSLWSTIRLPLKRQFPHHLMQEWLKRSAQMPLFVRIFGCKSPDTSQEVAEHDDVLLRQLATQGHRWKWADFVLPASIYNNRLACFQEATGHLDILERLNIGMYVDEPLEEVHLAVLSSIEVFREAPMLTTVSLWNRMEAIPLPWAQFVDLEYNPEVAFRIIAGMRRSPNLHRFAINSSARTGSAPPDPVRLPQTPTTLNDRLRVVRIESILQLSTVTMFLVLPSLEELHIANGYVMRYLPWLVRHLSSFINRSRCNLRKLSVRDIPCENGELVQLLSLMPHLEELAILAAPPERAPSTAGVSDRIIRSLTHTAYDATAICPKLHTMHLEARSTLDAKVLSRMLVSRTTAIPDDASQPSAFTRLRYIKVSSRNLAVNGSSRRFTKLQGIGLDLVFEKWDN